MSIDPIPRQLRAARRAARRSQQSVGGVVGVHQSVISEWERGVCGITLSSLRTWAASLGFDVALVPVGPQGSCGGAGRLHQHCTHGPAESTKEGETP